MTKRNIIKEAILEIESLKNRLTDDQKYELIEQKEMFNPMYSYSCIYGILFQDSMSKEAIKFTPKILSRQQFRDIFHFPIQGQIENSSEENQKEWNILRFTALECILLISDTVEQFKIYDYITGIINSHKLHNLLLI